MDDREMALWPASIKKIYLDESGLDRCTGQVLADVLEEVRKHNPRDLRDSRTIVRQIVARDAAKLAKSMSGYEVFPSPPRALTNGVSVWGDGPKPWYQNQDSVSALRVVFTDNDPHGGLMDPKNPHLGPAGAGHEARKRVKDWNALSAFLDMANPDHKDLILVDRSDAETVAKSAKRLLELASPLARDLASDK